MLAVIDAHPTIFPAKNGGFETIEADCLGKYRVDVDVRNESRWISAFFPVDREVDQPK